MSNHVAKKIISVFSTNIISILMAVVSVLVLARGLGATDRGIYAALLVIPNLLVSIVEGGVRQSAVYFIGSEKYRINEIICSLKAYTYMTGILGYVFCCIVMYLSLGSDVPIVGVFFASLIVPLTVVYNSYRGIFLGLEVIDKFNHSTWINKLVFMIILLYLLFVDEVSPSFAIASLVIGLVVSIIYCELALKGSADFSKKDVSFDIIFLMLKKGLLFALALFLIQANYKIDILFMSKLSSLAELGVYSVTVQVAEIVWQLPAAALVVIMSRSANEKNSNELIKTVSTTTRIVFWITLVIVLCSIVFFEFFNELIFGEDYQGLVKVLVLLSPGLALASFFKTLNAYFAGKGNPMPSIIAMLFAVVVNVCLNLILIPEYGANGAAIASSISYFIMSLLLIIVYLSKTGERFSSLILIKRSDFRK